MITSSAATCRVTDDYHRDRLTVKIDGKRFVTPMLLTIIAIGFIDLVFAVDSIPAIYGLTSEAYIVFTANAFALMGLRQLYFLIGGLLERLVYLAQGLAVILGFIGVKLVLHALHVNELPFINGGHHVEWVARDPDLVLARVHRPDDRRGHRASLRKTRGQAKQTAHVGAPDAATAHAAGAPVEGSAKPAHPTESGVQPGTAPDAGDKRSVDENR